MKKKLVYQSLLKSIFIILLFFSSCSKKPQATPAVTISEEVQTSKSTTVSSTTTKIDYDLSNMNFTMISSFFFQMLIEPETYENKTFKIKGTFQTFENPESDTPYFSVIMNDVTMCCQEGMDFVWEGEHKWPQEYPEEGTEISIIGKYIITEEDGLTYSYLLVSDLIPETAS